MDFYAMIDQVVKLLQQRGRLTYQSLRRQFDLDDEALEDLTDELLFSHPVVEVGRESEVTLLLERWQQVKEGRGQVVLLSGEAGIGKSRLLQVIKDHVAGEAHTL